MLRFLYWILLLATMQSCNSSPEAPSQTPTDADLYTEQHRPQFHFSPPSKWMNDPNGMVFFEGEYHLFYQYYPDSTVWGPMHWGHAVSSDLTHWEHLPIALYPDSLGYIFSGSAVVDWHNTTGLGKNGEPPMIAIFTHHNAEMERAGRNDFQFQSIAYSHDKGRSWIKYANNPVLPNSLSIRDFRDPKVIWDAANQQWLMVFAAQNQVKIWTSPNLIDWTHRSDFGATHGSHAGIWECPDLFPIQLEGSDEIKWVLLLSINPGGPNGGSATQYFVGNFDGAHFQLDPSFAPWVTNEQAVWLDYGRDNYAGVTWSDLPATDGRRIFLGWMSNWDYAQVVPTASWRSAMTLPRSLVLRKTAEGYRLLTSPVEELKALREVSVDLPPSIAVTSVGDYSITDSAGFGADRMELILTFLLKDSAQVGLQLRNQQGETYRLGYEQQNGRFFSDRTQAGSIGFSEKFAASIHYAPRSLTQDTLQLHIFIDWASAELFADGGATVLTDIFFPTTPFTQASLFGLGEQATLLEGKAYRIAPIFW